MFGVDNDSDPDGDALTVTGFSNGLGGDEPEVAAAGETLDGSNGGLFTINADGSYSFNPAGDFEYLNDAESETTSVDYSISDGEGGTSSATLTVTVTGVNDAPELTVEGLDDQADEDAAEVSLDVSGNFADVDGAPLSYSASGLPAGLEIAAATGVISGTIDNSASQVGEAGVYSVTVTAFDGTTGTDATFEWVVTNPAPTAVDDSNGTDEDTILDASGNSVGVDNDSDPDGDALTVTMFSNGLGGDEPEVAAAGETLDGSNGGLFTINADGSYSFNPAGDFEYLNDTESETTSVDYSISDGEGGTSSATLTVTVTGVNDAPELTVEGLDDQADEDAAEVSLDVSGNFADVDGAPLSYSASGLPAGLEIAAATGVISGTIDNSASQVGEAGVYSVTVTAFDGTTGTDATFEWVVTNPAPTAVDDSNSTDEDTILDASGNSVFGVDNDMRPGW